VVELGVPYIMREVRGVVVRVYPVQYNPVRGVLRVYRSLTVSVERTGGVGENELELTWSREPSLAFHQMYGRHFVNYGMGGGPRYAPLDETGDLLIICHDAWIGNVQALAAHKTGRGINTTVVGVSTIGNNATSIKNYIQGVYNTSDLAFVLLVGDAAQVASPTASGGSSDPTYSKLAGSDNYPDILVGRFSAETSGQVDTQVQRTITYETLPAPLQDWYWRGTGIASNQGPGDDGEYDHVHIGNIRTQLLANGYTLVDAIYDPNATAAMVSTALNNGRGIVNYCGHGSTTSWGSSGFSNSHIAALTNVNMLPFIFSVACVNGQFAGTTCFGEAWLRATQGGQPTGAIAAYMSSINQSWNPPMEAQDEFNTLIVNESYWSIGALFYAGSCSMMDQYGSGGVDMFNTWIVFGDPSVRVIGVAEPPTGLKVTPAGDGASAGPRGGPFLPGSYLYTLENKNAAPLSYQVSTNVPWLTVANDAGVIPASGSVAVTVSINATANTLPAGAYAATVSFVNLTDHDGDTTRGIALTVGGPAYDPVAHSQSLSVTNTAPTNITLSGTDPNADPLTFVIESLPLAGTGLLVDPNAGLISTVPHTLSGNVVRYLPPYGQTVNAAFTFTVRDASATSNVATVSLTVGAGVPQVVHSFPLDSNPGWSTEGLWAFGTPTGGGSHNRDPNSGYTGSYVYGYNLNGDYPNNMTVARFLTTTAIDCRYLTGTTLRFRRWLGVEGSLHDFATVAVSNDGVNWSQVWQNPTGSAVSEAAWSLQTYDISGVADGQATVYVRWGMGPTDVSVTYPGWNIDDVEIVAVVNASCDDFLPGDANRDGLVNGLDIQAFVGIVLDPYAPSLTFAEFCAADLNRDGFVTVADVSSFVSALLGQ